MDWRARVLIAAAAVCVAPRAWSQTYSVYAVSNGSAGTVAAAANGLTVFQVYTTARLVSGSGAYITGPITSAIATIACADGVGSANSCANNSAHITVTRTGVITGRGQTLSDIGVEVVSGGSLSGHTYDSNGGSGLDCTLTGWTAAGNLQIRFGMWLPVQGDNASLATSASSQFLVAVAKSPAATSGGTTGLISATVRRALTLSKTADLRFGSFVPPQSGDAYLVLDQNDNRSVANGAGTLTPLPGTYGSAHLTLGGEPGSAYTLSYPASFTMAGPNSASLTVTLSPTAPGSGQTVPAGASLNIGIGGSIHVSAGQASGAYSGSFSVTIVYN